MKKTIFGVLIFLSCFYSIELYSACGSFSFKAKGGLKIVSTTSEVDAFVSAAKDDSAQIISIYECIKKAATDAVDGGTATAYSPVFDQAAILEAGSRKFAAELVKTTATLEATASTSNTYVRVYRSPDKAIAELKLYSTSAKDIADKLTKITYGTMVQNNMSSDNAGCIGTKENIEALNKNFKDTYTSDAPAGSVLGDNAKAATDEDIKKNAAKHYTEDETGVKNFKADITNKKFDVAAVDASTTAPTLKTTTDANKAVTTTTTPSTGTNAAGRPQAPPAATTNTSAADKTAAAYKETKDNLDKLLALQAAKEKEKTPTASTPLSSGGDVNNQSLGALKSFEQDRAKREKDMEERQRQQKIQAIIKEARSKTKLPKGSSLSFQSPRSSSSGGSGGGSSLFGSKESDDDDASKKAKPSIFDKTDKDSSSLVTSKKGDYSDFYSSSNVPNPTSSKDLALNRFSSMYEMARRRALVEDAKSEFAGRYIDIFLLQHTVIYYDYYCKGLLIDVGEEVTPIGDDKTRI